MSEIGGRLRRRTDLPEPPVTTETFDDLSYEQVSVDFDREEKALFYYMQPRERPSFTVDLLREIGRVHQSVRDVYRRCAGDEGRSVRHLVLASRSEGIFNLGGDLSLFAKLIAAGDRDALRHYGKLCIDLVHANNVNLNLPLVTYSLVQGDALGGGFEAALSSDVIIAERSAKFGLPEVLFNLFPGMGAYSLLARRVAPAMAERIILSGAVYSAEELHELGVVDVVTEDGEGQAAFYEHLRRNRRCQTAQASIFQVRRMVNPIPYEELANVVDLWVDTALQLEASDLKRMLRLAAAQDRRVARSDEGALGSSDVAPPVEERSAV